MEVVPRRYRGEKSTSEILLRTAAGVFGAGALLVTACGESGADTSTPEAADTESPEPEVSPTHDETDWAEMYQEAAEEAPEEDWPQGEVQEPVEDLSSLHYLERGDYEEVEDDVLRFYVFMGNPNCYGLQYEVEETDDEVAVAVISGMREGVDVCTADGFFGALDVELDEPVGDRDVVDLSQRR